MQTLRDHECQPRLLYTAKLPITIEEQNKIFHEKTIFVTNPALHKVLEGKLQSKGLATLTETQTINYLTTANPKEVKKHTN